LLSNNFFTKLVILQKKKRENPLIKTGMIKVDFLLQLTAGGCNRSGPSDLKSAAEMILLLEKSFKYKPSDLKLKAKISYSVKLRENATTASPGS
jgi:hypothetical protein